MRRIRARPLKLCTLLLAAALVFAQWGLLKHQVTADQHLSGHACEWCLAHGHLADAAPAAAVVPFAPMRDLRPTTSPAGDVLPFLAAVYRSRAPPFAFA